MWKDLNLGPKEFTAQLQDGLVVLMSGKLLTYHVYEKGPHTQPDKLRKGLWTALQSQKPKETT